jgi:hypothetical protein
MSQPSMLQLVDVLAERATSVSAQLVRSAGIATRSQTLASVNALVADLSVEHREMLAALLQHERETSLVDALVALHEQCIVGGWAVHAEGKPLALEPNGYTLAEEFIRRTAPP